jgi:hypothetical protein
MTTKFEDCGTPKAYHRHRRVPEDACQPCKDAIAEYERTREKKPFQGPKPRPECGSDKAYHAHVRRHETPCDHCKRAHADEVRIRRETARVVKFMARA